MFIANKRALLCPLLFKYFVPFLEPLLLRFTFDSFVFYLGSECYHIKHLLLTITVSQLSTAGSYKRLLEFLVKKLTTEKSHSQDHSAVTRRPEETSSFIIN
jgi:hypothetical protein